MSGLANQLRKAVLDSGETLYRIAQESGMHEPTLRRFMAGQRDITLGRADLLADYFGLRLAKKTGRK